MTSEVVVMNKLAIAMAADSAVTSYTQRGQKVFYTANKIFTLSKIAPIGVMVYARGDFLQIPWETIIKVYRAELGRRKFSTTEEYAVDLVRFLSKHRGLFTASHQRVDVLKHALWYIGKIYNGFEEAIKEEFEHADELSEREIRLQLSRFISDRLSSIRKDDIEPTTGFTLRDIERFVTRYRKEIIQARRQVFFDEDLTNSAKKNLIQIVGEYYCRKYPSGILSGLVVAGFGEKEYRPCVVFTELYGIALNKIKSSDFIALSVDDETVSRIIPFAQRDIIETYLDGIDPTLRGYIRDTFIDLLKQYREAILEAIPNLSKKDKDRLRSALGKANTKLSELMENSVQSYKKEKHVDPVMDVVRILPKDELAIMAETLISLTSFKRKITPGSETVGEPIDVAMITKGDGFVWINRKHYFDSKLNPHWFHNYMGEIK